MFENLGWWEIALLLVLALFIFGPDRLPKVAADAARLLRKARDLARGASAELKAHLPENVDVADLHPKNFIRKHLLSEDDEEALRRPFQQVFNEVDEVRRPVTGDNDKFRRYAEIDEVGEVPPASAPAPSTSDTAVPPPSRRFDPDAT